MFDFGKVKEDSFVPNTITLNIPMETEFDFHYDEDSCSLITKSVEHLDITDGYHRYIAACQAKDKNQNFDYAVFSDDSGLFVEALKGEPGVFSARYAKAHDDEANRQKLLKNLKRRKNKNAYFECVICYLKGEEEQIFSGQTHGTILPEYKGDTSFGYDCVFLSNDLNKSFGEASKEEKDSVSHRARAVLKLKEYLGNNKK